MHDNFCMFRSRQVIDAISDSYYLVNLVDNDYPKETVLWEILDQMLELGGGSGNDDTDNHSLSECSDVWSESDDDLIAHLQLSVKLDQN